MKKHFFYQKEAIFWFGKLQFVIKFVKTDCVNCGNRRVVVWRMRGTSEFCGGLLWLNEPAHLNAITVCLSIEQNIHKCGGEKMGQVKNLLPIFK